MRRKGMVLGRLIPACFVKAMAVMVVMYQCAVGSLTGEGTRSSSSSKELMCCASIIITIAVGRPCVFITALRSRSRS